jgi:cbb3-type cytochrome oxidase cytochrome c subunit
MKSNRLQKYESKIEPEASPEQIKQAREWMVNSVMEAYDRLPANIQPVAESLQELARQAKFGVPRQSTIIQTSESDTGIISGGSLEVPKNVTKTIIEAPKNVTSNILTDSDLEVLRKIQNGES